MKILVIPDEPSVDGEDPESRCFENPAGFSKPLYRARRRSDWIPAFAGMTIVLYIFHVLECDYERKLKNPHPGDILKYEFLDEIGMSQNALVQILYDQRETKRKIASQVARIKPFRQEEYRPGA